MDTFSSICPAIQSRLLVPAFLRERPLIPFAMCLAGGIFLCDRQPLSWLTLTLLLLPLTGAFLISMGRNQFIPAQVIMYSLTVLTGMLIMIPYADLPSKPVTDREFPREKITYRGFINDAPQPSRDGVTYILSHVRPLQGAGAQPVSGRLLLDARVPERFRYGDFVQFRVRLTEPRNFQNPGGFDYRKYLFRRGILQRVTVSNPPDLILIRRNTGNQVKAGIEAYRDRLRAFVTRHAESPQREILQAMILGEQKTIPEALRERFNRTGTSHIIAISGFNVGLIAFFSFVFFMAVLKIHPWLLLAWNAPKVAYAMTLIPILLYTVIAGMGTPVMRATLMVVTLMTALMLGKPKDLFNTLALAAIIILALSPPALFDPSFQLSFAAVAAILAIPPLFTSLLPTPQNGDTQRKIWLIKSVRMLGLFLLVSLSATLGTLPIIAYHFYRLSTVVLPANLTVVPFLGILTTPLCLLITVVYPLSEPLCVLLVRCADYLIQISVFFVNFFSSLPGASFLVAPPAWYDIVAYYLVLSTIIVLLTNLLAKGPLALWNRIRKPATAVTTIAIVGMAGVLFHSYLSASPSPYLRLIMLDVGQGSSTILQIPTGETMLIDGGGFEGSSFDVGRYVVAPFLIRQKILKLDVVVLTHPHPDHLNGLLYILENFPVREVWTNGDKSPLDSYVAFEEIIHRKNIPNHVLHGGMPEQHLGDLRIRILNPCPEPITPKRQTEAYQAENDRSLVLQLRYSRTGLLLPGDISQEIENHLITAGHDLQSDVFLAPHHGSRTSSSLAFLDKVKPQVVVFSCGLHNRHNAPHPEVIKRYRASVSRIFRTDQDGAIILQMDGTRIMDGNSQPLFP
jgi:competence protein ComEC